MGGGWFYIGGQLNIKKAIFGAIGFVFFGIGVLGIYLPLLPATPFMIIAAACFARSSDRFNSWFQGTKFFKENVRPIIKKEGMTKRRKLKILAVITIFLGISFFVMHNVYGRIVIIFILLGHYIYFYKGIKTID